MKRSLRFVLRKETPYNVINVSGPFSVSLQQEIFHEVHIFDTTSTVETAKKITKILQSFDFQLDFESLKSAKRLLVSINFQKLEPFSDLPNR